jgi:hypothetical protein
MDYNNLIGGTPQAKEDVFCDKYSNQSSPKPIWETYNYYRSEDIILQ